MSEAPITSHVEQTPGGYKVLDANGQALVYVSMDFNPLALPGLSLGFTFVHNVTLVQAF